MFRLPRWLRLSRAEGVGPRTFQGLINRFGGAGAALEALPMLAAARGRHVRIPSASEGETELRQAEKLGIRLLASGEEDYPARLLEIDGPPPILAVRGDPLLLHRKAVALVGARNASALGRKMAMRLADGLAEAGYLVVSGLARGIDTEAHRASLDRGTVAVLAGGLDKPYPPENEALYNDICASGAAISEMPLGLSPRGRDFPRRNRLIAGLSLGVVIVEAARRSGSLITARLAAEAGREVMAVPGSPLDPRAQGCNQLIRDGAMLVQSAADVIELVTGFTGSPRSTFREAAAGYLPLPDELGDQPADIAALLAGVVLNDDPEPVAAVACERVAPTQLRLTLTEGKYHQVKRMIAAVGNRVEALHRAQMGGLALDAALRQGQWRWLTADDLALLRAAPHNPKVHSTF